MSLVPIEDYRNAEWDAAVAGEGSDKTLEERLAPIEMGVIYSPLRVVVDAYQPELLK